MKTKAIFAFILLLSIRMEVISQDVSNCNIDFEEFIYYPLSTECTNIPANSSISYQDKYSQMSFWIPNQHTPIKTIKIAFHIFNDANGDGTMFPDDLQTISDIQQILTWTNDVFTYIAQPSNPIQGVDFYEDTKVRFSLENVFFYNNSNLNNCFSSSKLNYILTNHPERLEYLPILIGSYSCTPHANIPYPNWVGTGGATTGNINGISFSFLGSSTIWNFSRTLVHELSHNLDLLHTYYPSCCHETCNQSNQDFLWDVFDPNLGSNCWHDAGWGCDIPDTSNTCTNNIMGGVNQGHYYFSPLQIGKIHRSLAIKSVRRYVKDVKSEVPLVINAIETWDFSMKLYQDLIIEEGGSLNLDCELILPQDGKIIVKYGGSLVLNGTLKLNKNNLIVVENGGSLAITEDSELTINSAGKIEVMSGGFFCLNDNIDLTLSDFNSAINLRNGYINLSNPPFNTCVAAPCDYIVTGDGSINCFNQDLYIQDETISTNRYYAGNNIYVGYDVTQSKPYGNVLINNNSKVIFDAENIVLFKNGFDVATGSSFDVPK